MLAWKNYGNNHVIFDASNGTSPSGTSISSANSDIAWSNTLPVLMGWNGSNTYGVRVDSARLADNATNWGNRSANFDSSAGDLNVLIGRGSDDITRNVTASLAKSWLGLNNGSTLTNNISGNANDAHYLLPRYVGGDQPNPQTYFGQGTGLGVAMTRTNLGAWNDTLWINGYSGGDVLDMCALHTLRNGQPRMFISSQQSTATTYGTQYEMLSTYNMSSHVLPLTGGNISGYININRVNQTGLSLNNVYDDANICFNTYGAADRGYTQGKIALLDEGAYGGKFTFSTKTNGADANGLVTRLTLDSQGGIINGRLDVVNGSIYAYGGLSVGTAGARTGNLANVNSIAIGDTDTGFRQNGDGVLETYANNVLVRTDTSTVSTFNVNIRVGNGLNSSYIFMGDGDEGERMIHCNSNRIGFLTQAGAWSSWCDDNANWFSDGNISAGSAVSGSRLYSGWDSGNANSISCSNWFRSNSSSGWYNETFGGGIYMQSSDYVEVSHGKKFKVSNIIEASGSGGFASSTYAVNSRNPIWRFANADTYGLSYFQGTAGYAGQDTIGLHFGTATAAGSIFLFNQYGSMIAGGSITATGFYESSDIRLKNIIDKHYSEENLDAISEISYTWKDSTKGTKAKIGYSAQEVQKHIPEAVEEDGDGMLSVNYIQVLVAKVAALEKRLKKLEHGI